MRFALPFAFDAIPGIGDDFQPCLGNHRFGRSQAGFQTTLTLPIRAAVDALQRFRHFVEEFLLILNAPQGKVLLIVLGAQFRKMSWRFGLGTITVAIERFVSHLLDIALNPGTQRFEIALEFLQFRFFEHVGYYFRSGVLKGGGERENTSLCGTAARGSSTPQCLVGS